MIPGSWRTTVISLGGLPYFGDNRLGFFTTPSGRRADEVHAQQ